MKLPIMVAALSCFLHASCAPTGTDSEVRGTRLSSSGVDVAWFERPTDATVASTFILKIKGKGDDEWVECGTFQKIEASGPHELPTLSMKGWTLKVSFEKADIYDFRNRVYVRNSGLLQEIRIRLHENG